MHIAVLDIGTGGFHAALYTAGGELLTDGYQAISYRGGRRSRNLEFDADELFLRGMRLLASLIVRVPGNSGPQTGSCGNQPASWIGVLRRCHEAASGGGQSRRPG